MGERRSVINLTSQYMDDNINIVRAVPFALLGTLGLYCTYRYRIFSHFKTIKSIPEEFYTKRVSLRGKLTNVTRECTLEIEHVPIVKLPFSKYLKNKETEAETLPIKFLGIDFPSDTSNLAYTKLLHLKQSKKPVWFQLWYREYEQVVDPDDATPIYLHCLVYEPYWFLGSYLNTTFVKIGYAKFTSLPDLISTGKQSEKLANSLAKAENFAKRKRRGMWYVPSKPELIYEDMKTKANSVKSAGAGAWNGLKKLKEKFWKSKQ
ncbi:protein C3orf33 homolog [Ciona intestinalis]